MQNIFFSITKKHQHCVAKLCWHNFDIWYVYGEYILNNVSIFLNLLTLSNCLFFFSSQLHNISNLSGKGNYLVVIHETNRTFINRWNSGNWSICPDKRIKGINTVNHIQTTVKMLIIYNISYVNIRILTIVCKVYWYIYITILSTLYYVLLESNT